MELEKLESPTRGKLHLWHFPLAASADRMHQLRATLSDAERERADRFKFDRHRRRFVVRRSVLRALLQRYLDIPAKRISYQTGEYGKPVVSPDASASGVHFSTSHSEDMGVILVSDLPQSGVDVEYLHRVRDAAALADSLFCEQEHRMIQAEPEANRQQVFLNIWTGKEAYLKALGLGLSVPVDSFCVEGASGSDPGLRWDQNRPDTADEWRFRRADIGPDHVATIAMRGTIKDVCLLSADF